MDRLGLQLLNDRPVVWPDFERLVRIDLIEHPQAVGDKLKVVRLRAAGDLVKLLDASVDEARVGRRSDEERP